LIATWRRPRGEQESSFFAEEDSRAAVLFVTAGLVLLLGPWWLRIASGLLVERQARARAEELQNFGRKGDLRPAHALFEFLKDDIAELERKLRGYARPTRPVRRFRPRGARRKRK